MDRLFLKKTALFEGLTDDEISAALAFLDARESAYEKGDTVKPLHQPFTRFALVMQGRVQVYTDDLSGEQMMMAHVEKGGMFGESLSFLRKDEPVYAIAASPCRILWLSPENIRRLQPQNALEQTLIHRFIASLASRALQMNDRIQILSKKTLEEKLKAFLSLYQMRRGMHFTIPFTRTELATYLGVNRSALSRVMSRMQKKGVFTCEGRHFTLHQPLEN
ncbi:MAG: Crp/Fnr family transcriptional regulator [Clostridia bacterium]|nr:Crp/Fnr family transcriptional regulator [Clostridia bacterium]